MQIVTLSQASRDELKKECECWSCGQAEPLHIGEPTIFTKYKTLWDLSFGNVFETRYLNIHGAVKGYLR